jgi:hypothetical protein
VDAIVEVGVVSDALEPAVVKGTVETQQVESGGFAIWDQRQVMPKWIAADYDV